MEAIIKALKETDYLDGILNFLDAIQDGVVEDKIKTERQVFGKLWGYVCTQIITSVLLVIMSGRIIGIVCVTMIVHHVAIER